MTTRVFRRWALAIALALAGIGPFLTARAGEFIIGADISSNPEQVDRGIVFVDTDGQQKSLISLLKNHGFNFIRLRTFVDPLADYGYASGDACPGKAEAYNDLAHIVEFAQQVKAAGMGFLLDLHYSDTWADPGKQVIPEAWRGAASVEEMASFVTRYTTDVMQALKKAGAPPDMVQVGNEITPGLLIHVPTPETDCFGNHSVAHTGPNGSAADWDNLALLLGAGIDAVKAVLPRARIMLHIENTADFDGIVAWVNAAHGHGLEFDILGLSAYERWQGPTSQWRQTFRDLAKTFPGLEFSIVEYGGERRLVNDIMAELSDQRGIGTFIWEPTLSGPWGDALFEREGQVMTARAEDFAVYDRIAQTNETCREVGRLFRKKQRSAARRAKAGESPVQAACLGDEVAQKCRDHDFPVCGDRQVYVLPE